MSINNVGAVTFVLICAVATTGKSDYVYYHVETTLEQFYGPIHTEKKSSSIPGVLVSNQTLDERNDSGAYGYTTDLVSVHAIAGGTDPKHILGASFSGGLSTTNFTYPVPFESDVLNRYQQSFAEVVDTIRISGNDAVVASLKHVTVRVSLDGTFISNSSGPPNLPDYEYPRAYGNMNVQSNGNVLGIIGYDQKFGEQGYNRMTRSGAWYGSKMNMLDIDVPIHFDAAANGVGYASGALDLQLKGSLDEDLRFLYQTLDSSGDFVHTLSIDGLSLPDGSTPESKGLSLSFDSGMLSPNLSAVPEPSSFVLLGTAAAVGLVAMRRRKRAA